ncbi:MAG: DUF4340 domain-containing protein [Steroidobacteraceae bacterium]
MTSRKLTLLLLAALVVIGGALWLSQQRSLPRDLGTETKLFDSLQGELNAIDSMTVSQSGERTTLQRSANGWQVAERGFAADQGKLRKFLIDFAGLRIAEKKTSLPAKYTELGIDDPSKPGASSTLVELRSGEKSLAAVILGKNAGGRGVFARKPGDAQGLLVEPSLSPSAKPADWLAHELVDIAAKDIVGLTVTQAGRTYRLRRPSTDSPHLAIVDLPKGRTTISDDATDQSARALEKLEMTDLAHRSDSSDFSPVDHARAELSDGTFVDIAGHSDNNRARITIDAGVVSGATDNPAAPSAETMRRLAGFVFDVPTWRYTSLFRPLEDMLKPAG